MNPRGRRPWNAACCTTRHADRRPRPAPHPHDGLELTRVSVPYGDRDTIRDQKALPEAFLGFGADIRIGSGTFIGASMRMHVMGNFDYDPQRLQMGTWVSEPTPSEVFSASPSLAAQGQFYLRREL